ncbi:glucosamine-6-phosphate deaminase [Alicyclobacillus ferrooxydans]|uniref:Glucosamine-6-phosphate deaminase n=1 Tax=Alicyclobacillus ferrooxydans TaxID=471514 RepID=A0A0N8PPC3_9BACL|nr:glucosamine-6-phosphate deaminase [Alicyclobacillus ferrooxydans]KPV43925.1 glucosamine-6-phosphate deaminase [Alicyclobacillus ferrooxydans]
MKIRVFESEHDAGLYAAALAERIVQDTEHPVLGLATGRTVLPFYEALVRLEHCGLDLSRCITINLDEYIGLEADHPQSYHRFMHEHLFHHVHIPESQIHIPNGTALNLDVECARYDEVLNRHPIDFQLLGIGVNGHVGFNEPNDLLQSKTHVVNLTPETITHNAKFFPDMDQVPKSAITMGVQAILQAKQIVLMAFGEEKADIVARAIHGEVRTDIPASILQLHRDVTIVLDEASARKLPGRKYL